MKKTIALNILVFLLLSCNQANKKKEKHNIYNSKDSITEIVDLSINPKSFKLSSLPETVEIEMNNKTSDTITTGDHYQIEKLEVDKWINILPRDMLFYDIGYIIKPFDNKIFDKKLFKNKINYESGKYRVVKYYVRPNNQKTKGKNNVYAEFEIE